MILNLPITLTYTGVDETLTRLDLLQVQIQVRIADTLRVWAEATVQKINEGHPPGGPHPLPGEMPVYGEHAYIDRTGRLTRSVGYTVEKWSERTVTCTIFATMPYAELVEYGTPRSRPYPFFWPVIWARVPLLETALQEMMDRTFEEFGDYGRS